MRAQLRADAGQQDRELEGLGHIVVRARVEAQDRVGIGIMAGQHQDRAFHAPLAHPAAQLAPVGVGQAHVEDHQIVERGLDLLHALGAVPASNTSKSSVITSCSAQRLAQVVVVVDEQDLLRGWPSIGPSVSVAGTDAPDHDSRKICDKCSRGRVGCAGNVSIPSSGLGMEGGWTLERSR
jgi:hypothetical protein